jgi:fused signal recognition particle receptor
MRRWFRRKAKAQETSLPEQEAPPEEEAAAPLVPAAESEPASGMAGPVGAGLPRPYEEPPADEAVPHEGDATTEESEAAEEAPEASPAPEAAPRPGLFKRLWQGSESQVLEASCAEALVRQKAALEGEPAAEAEAQEAARSEEMVPEAEAPEALEPEAASERRPGVLRRFKERLSRTRENLAGGLDRLFAGRRVVDAELLEELEELLITADLGVETTQFLVGKLQEKLKRRELADVERLRQALKAEMVALLEAPPPQKITARPRVVLLVGVNGVGKTTSIAKLAHRDREQGLSTLLVAGDTFRAAAAEQLEIWGERVGAPVIRQQSGADPAAVVFDGLGAALARGVDTVYIDTAGRLHTKVNLMEELKKVHRTAAKKVPGAPQEVLLILDATTGQNALSQAREFHEAVAVTGIILTKMDGTAKGGVALAVAFETGIPIRYLGVGEGMDDLRPFEPQAFVEAILG